MKCVIDINPNEVHLGVYTVEVNKEAKLLEDRTHWFKQMEKQLGLPEDKKIEAVYIQFKENV